MVQTSSERRHKLKAADFMTRKVIAVRPDTPAQTIAMLLFRHGISAVPVIDDSGAPVGMVSEGDLLPRDESEREERRDWWLRMLAEGEELSPEFIARVESQDREDGLALLDRPLRDECRDRPLLTSRGLDREYRTCSLLLAQNGHV